MHHTANEAGGIVVLDSVASGGYMDNAADSVKYADNPSGTTPVGILLGKVVDKDLTQMTLQRLASEYIVHGKVPVNRAGQYKTNMVYPGLTIAMNDKAYLGPSGLLQNTQVNAANNPYVGEFDTTKDQDGFVTVTLNLPSN